MRHASEPRIVPEDRAKSAAPLNSNTDELPQLYRLAQKNLPPAGNTKGAGPTGESPAQQATTATSAGAGAPETDTGDAAPEDAVQLSVRRARSRFFDLPAEEVGAAANSALSVAPPPPAELTYAGGAEQPPEVARPQSAGRLRETSTLPAPVDSAVTSCLSDTTKAPPPPTLAAPSGDAGDTRPLEDKSGFLARPPLPAGGKGGQPELLPAGWETDPALLNPADPVNLRGLIDADDLPLTEPQKDRAERDLRAELTGLGILEPLLATPGVTDIFVNGTEVWVEAAGTLRRAATRFESREEVRALASRLIGAAGGRLDDSQPIADVQTASGLRVHAVLPPLSRAGALLSIRVGAADRPGLESLQRRGMFGRDTEQVLRHLVRTRANFLISGGTGTGKTTLLAALLGSCGADERLVLVEDTTELFPAHPHAVSLQAREANTEGRGEVSLTELIRAALRMRPTRLIVGECRGAEVVDMLSAMNTGHAGTGGTLHANSTAAVPARLYAMGALAGLSERAVALQAATALDYIVHIERVGGVRRVAEIARLTLAAGELAVNPVCRVERGRRGDYLHWLPAGSQLREALAAEGTEGKGRHTDPTGTEIPGDHGTDGGAGDTHEYPA